MAKKKKKKAGAKAAATPRRESIPGIAPDLPDFANWVEAARVLKVAPFYSGPDPVPFSRLWATQILDPMRGQRSYNDFYLE